MDQQQAKRILVGLKSYSLTSTQRRFVELTEEFIDNGGILNEEQESILKGIHREKKRWKVETKTVPNPPGITSTG
jgi:hypothetical protein